MPTVTPPAPTSPAPAARWLSRPWIDLTVGCGAWSAPLLALVYLVAAPEQRAWSIAFYALAVVFNYPHFMATIHRAYRTEAERARYRLFTVHVTLVLALTGGVVHTSTALVAWLFTLYITWSPWHYTGQNYGLLMMFVRRAGGTPTAGERHALYAAFVASYVMLFLAFHAGVSADPLVRSLRIPDPVALAGQLGAALVFTAAGGWALWRLTRRLGLEPMTAPLTLMATQVLWFVLPTALERGYGLDTPQSRYSSGMLAILHALQYLWITGYYARREAPAGQWRWGRYYLTLVVGGIALFIPGPWVVSYLFAYDFTTTFMVFTAVVNIHHFILDGALWKLRDGRVAAILLDVGARARAAAALPRATPRWWTRHPRAAGGLRVSVAAVLVGVGTIDLARYATALGETTDRVRAAARLNPYDNLVQSRLGTLHSRAGDLAGAESAWTRAVALNPTNRPAQHALGRLLVDQDRIDEALAHYTRMVVALPDDVDALVNHGILASRAGQPAGAVGSWRAALALDPGRAEVQLGLADLLDATGQPEAARAHYEAYLAATVDGRDGAPDDPPRVVTAVIKLADLNRRLDRPDAALALYRTAETMATQTDLPALRSIALGERAALLDAREAHPEAVAAYQEAIAHDRARRDPEAEAIHWLRYGRLLERLDTDPRLAYACVAEADALLAASTGPLRAEAAQARDRLAERLSVVPADRRPLIERLLAARGLETLR